MSRAEGWPAILAACIEAARSRPFAWGRHDCAMFAAEVVAAMTGADLAEQWRTRYHDEAGARALIGAAGSLEQLASGVLGEACTPQYIGRGDVVLVHLADDSESLGIALDHRSAHATLPNGVALLSSRHWRCGWHV